MAWRYPAVPRDVSCDSGMLEECPDRSELLVLLGKRCPERVQVGVALVD